MKKQKVLVVGASGFLGNALMQDLGKKFDVIGTYNSRPAQGMIRLGLNDIPGIKKTLASVSPDIVVLAAADANVDLYESKPGISEMQVSSAMEISGWCMKNNKKLVFISTDFVFDGNKGNYSETDVPNPINQYGRNKLDIEKIVSSFENHLIIRTSTLYGLPVTGEKFVGKTIVRLSGGEKVQAAGDWKRNPTFTKDIAAALSLLLGKNYSGLLHLAGSTPASMHEIALAIASEFNVSPELVEKGNGSSLRLPAKRPLDTTLDCSLAKKMGIQMSSLAEGLKSVHKGMDKK